MSSRSIKTKKSRSSAPSVSAGTAGETRCPACGQGTVERVIVSRNYSADGKRVRIDGLMPDKCNVCGELTWSEAELKRADEAIRIKLRRVAA